MYQTNHISPVKLNESLSLKLQMGRREVSKSDKCLVYLVSMVMGLNPSDDNVWFVLAFKIYVKSKFDLKIHKNFLITTDKNPSDHVEVLRHQKISPAVLRRFCSIQTPVQGHLTFGFPRTDTDLQNYNIHHSSVSYSFTEVWVEFLSPLSTYRVKHHFVSIYHMHCHMLGSNPWQGWSQSDHIPNLITTRPWLIS